MKKASALVLVLVVMIIVGIGTSAILQAMISYSHMRLMTIERIQAEYLAEAGVQYAIAQLRNGNTNSPVNTLYGGAGSSELPDGWTINITKIFQPDGSYDITATVNYPGL